MHGQEIIHGDLKGVGVRTLVAAPPLNALFIKANVLIDQDGHARLIDFGLSMVSDSAYFMNLPTHDGGTTRWMSPELFDWGPSKSTKRSDCYSLGMVIFEVLSGQIPFAQFSGLTAMVRTVYGERPERPKGEEGAWFTDDAWETLEQCWSHQPERRPNVEAVLERLEQVSAAWHPPSPMVDDDVQIDFDERSLAASPSCMFPHSATDL